MPKYSKNHKDVEYYVPKRKKRVAGSTRVTSDFLATIHKQHPDFTIGQLYELLTDSSQYILDPEAVKVLKAHIEAGYKNYIPDWE